MNKYHNQKEFVCQFCSKDFRKKRQLRSHLRDAHPVELKQYQDGVVDEIITEVLKEKNEA